MRRWLSAAGLAAAITMIAAPVRAASLFDLFQELCLVTGADPTATLSKAEGLGWSKAPATLVRSLTKPSEPGEVTSGATGRAARDLRGVLAVVVARTNWMIPRQEIPADTCSVVAGPSIDVEAVARDVESFAAVPGQPGLVFQKSVVGYLWRDVEGRRQSLSPAQLAADPLTGDVKMLAVMKLKDIAILQLFVPAREPTSTGDPTSLAPLAAAVRP